MGKLTSYETINNLDDLTFIGGTNYYLNFTMYDDTGAPLNIIASVCKWVLAFYGQPDVAVLTKTGTITGTNTFKITLVGSDTINLSGKFIQQPSVTSTVGEVFKPGQGVVTIIPAIPVA